jgi:transketolase
MDAWTPETVKDAVDQRIDDLRLSVDKFLHDIDTRSSERIHNLDRAMTQHIESAARELRVAFDAAQQAIDKAEHAQELRNEQMNAFRQQLTEQAATFVLREVMDQRWEDQQERADGQRDEWNRQIQTIMLALANRLTKEEFKQYQDRQDDQVTSGKRSLNAAMVAILLGAASVVTSIVVAIIENHPK